MSKALRILAFHFLFLKLIKVGGGKMGMRCSSDSGEDLSVAILVCTRNRPIMLAACLGGISELVCPPGVHLSVIVGDNNDVTHRPMISTLAAKLGLEVIQVYEPRRGYCYVRNALLNAAVKQRPDVLIFIDDDHRPEPLLLSAYLDCLRRYDADVVHGTYVGSSRAYPEGTQASKVATYNVAFRWRLIAPTSEGGMELRFDPRLNLTGREDLEFFREAAKAGAHMIYSSDPVTKSASVQQTASALRSLTKYEIARNAVYVERLRRGWPAALFLFLKSYSRRVRGFRGGLDGLLFGGIDRQAAKGGQIIPIPAQSELRSTASAREQFMLSRTK